MPMPRVISGTAPSATVFNTLATEVDSLGTGCKVRRTSSQASIANNTDYIVTWQAADYDILGATATPMWSSANPNYVTIRVPGVYILVLQERWGPSGGNATGQRAGKIMINGSSVFTNSVASDKRAAATDNEGITLSMRTGAIPLTANTTIYCNYWQSSGSTITGLHPDYGGTTLTVSRRGPLTI